MTTQERALTYHTVTLGPLVRTGDALAEVSIEDETGEQRMLSLPIAAGLPGERVTIAVEEPEQARTGRHRRRWRPRPPRAWITEIHEASPLRTQAPCPVFGVCGGCQLQHMRYEAQIAWKRAVVQDLLREVGGFAQPPLLATVPCD
ncbi:MAG: hypothetical protein M3Z08_18215, partial [Chloroflexota bacterium]|nr:hypothetical protein [Chloroflexota bacterium]